MNEYHKTKYIPKAFVIQDLLKQYEAMDKSTPKASEFSQRIGKINALEKGHDMQWYLRHFDEMTGGD